MSGHNKWSSIKHKKGAADAKRGKIFSKITRELIVAVREGGGGDPEANAALRTVIQNARGVNIPMDNITRAIKKATGEGSYAVQYEELVLGLCRRRGWADHRSFDRQPQPSGGRNQARIQPGQ